MAKSKAETSNDGINCHILDLVQEFPYVENGELNVYG